MTMDIFRLLVYPVAVALSLVPELSMAQNVSLGRSLTAADQVSMDDVDHSIWNELLKSYVNDQGRVNYNAWQASQADSARLDDYLNQLSAASRSKSSTRQSQLAFWINAYNAVTVKGILREYPTSSIRNHTARFVGYNMEEPVADGRGYADFAGLN